jgi:hypothetical protein
VNGGTSQDRLVRNVLIGAVVIVILLVVTLLVALGFALNWYLSSETNLTIVQRKNVVEGAASAGQALAVFLTGAVGLIGLFFTWQNTNQARKSTQRTLQLTEQGQITERFTRAIDQLGKTENGKKVLEVRLGAIYALERIAKESKEDYGRVMEVLTAYVRENAKCLPNESSSANEAPQWNEWRPPGSSISLEYGAHADTQAVLDVLGRRDEARIPEAYRVTFNLNKTDLRGANLIGVNLAGVTLHNANLAGAWLAKTNLAEATLIGANLQGAILSGASLKGANLTGARLQGAYLAGGYFSGFSFQAARVLGSPGGGAEFQTFLKGADLADAEGLVTEQIKWAIGDSTTNLPSYLEPPEDWSKDTEAQEKIIEELIEQKYGKRPNNQADEDRS